MKLNDMTNEQGPYDLPEYEAGGRNNITMRDVADKPIAKESEASHE